MFGLVSLNKWQTNLIYDCLVNRGTMFFSNHLIQISFGSCQMVLMGENIYKKEYPPHDMMTDLANITVNLDIYDLGDFDERGMTFYVKFLIQLHW